MSEPEQLRRQGAAYALAAYSFWGFAPVYFVWVAFAAPLEVLAHRILWALPLLALLVTLSRAWPQLRQLSGPVLVRLVCCAALVSTNWLTFIYAVHAERIAETALGYFINPLISIVLGWLFLKEHLRPLQWLAAVLAASGICVELAVLGQLPILGLVLAITFGLYGLLRKQIQLPAALALGIETSMVAPFALGYLLYAGWFSGGDPRSQAELGLLALGGVVTVLPLVWFGAAASRLPLTLLGFFQYLAPTISLLLAVFVYMEEVSSARWTNLGLIWLGLLLFSLESVLHHRRGVRA